MPTCPSQDRWERLLTEESGDADALLLGQHLEGCAACREALDRLSADADCGRWRRLRRQGRSPGNEPSAEFLRRLEEGLSPSPAGAPRPPPPAEALPVPD